MKKTRKSAQCLVKNSETIRSSADLNEKDQNLQKKTLSNNPIETESSSENIPITGASQCTNVDDSDKDPNSRNLFDTSSYDADDSFSEPEFNSRTPIQPEEKSSTSRVKVSFI